VAPETASYCLDEDTVTGLVAGVLGAVDLPRVEAHLARCALCRRVVADAGYGALGPTLGVPALAQPANVDQAGAHAEGDPSSSATRAALGLRLRPGDLVGGKYRVEELLGRGGMGEVFAASHVELGHRVAIKVLHLVDSSANARFFREAQTCARLASEHIPHVFDLGNLADGTPYIVMECLAGQDLAQLMARGPLPASDAVSYVLQACAALQDAHAVGVVHRDIKPANLFLTTRKTGPGLLKVLDFGISKLAGEHGSEGALGLTSTGALVGSPLYMSPEQIRGSKDVDARTDIWSLGVVLYELLAGYPPFRAQTLSALSVAIATEQPRPLSSIRPDLHPAFEVVVSRCLEKDRAARFASVDALKEAIETMAAATDSRQHAPSRARLERPEVALSSPSSRTRGRELPAHLSPFIGRQAELERLAGLLADPALRLVTILAPGGMGKSRLAVEAARRLTHGEAPLHRSEACEELFAHGIYFVELAPLGSSDFLVATLADALGLSFHPGAEPKEQVVDHLREKRLLLVVDNFEHVLAGAVIIGEILLAAPGVRVLATSRERLGLSGETVFALSGMEVPEANGSRDTLALSSVQLFLQHARQLQPDFELTADDSAHVARICDLVQGMPLGIVLAATWIGLLRPKEIADEIARSLDFLETELRDVPRRQRSIRAVFDYSWDLLAADERRVFAELCVFRGGVSREAAQAVTGASLRTLAVLMDKSLLKRSHASGRYEVHEVLRQHGEARLSEIPGGLEHALDRLATFYSAFLDEREDRLKSAQPKPVLDDIDIELDNIRTAWRWMLQRNRLDDIRRAMGSLNRFYRRRALFAEGEAAFRSAVEALEATDGDSADRAATLGAALTMLAAFVRQQGRYSDALLLLDRAISLLSEDRHCREKASALVELGTALLFAGRPDEAVIAAERGLSLCRLTNDPWGIINALDRLGSVHGGGHWMTDGQGGNCGGSGDFAKAEGAYRESLDLQRSIGNGSIVLPSSLAGLGFTMTRQGRCSEGCAMMREALELIEQAGDVWNKMAGRLELGNVHRTLGDYGQAETYVRGCLSLARDVGSWQVENWAHFQLADIFKDAGRYDEAAGEYQRGHLRSVQAGDIGRIAVGNLNFGDLALIHGRYADAKRYLSESLHGFERVGACEWGIVLALDSLGYVECQEQHHEASRRYFRQALDKAMAGRLIPYATNVIAGVALLLAKSGDPQHALELLALVQAHPATERHTLTRRVEPLLAELSMQLPAAQFDDALARGRKMDLERVVRRGIFEQGEATANADG
jgi:serine/threonine protein kinase/predicted ATPase